jgi:hypothetical protein
VEGCESFEHATNEVLGPLQPSVLVDSSNVTLKKIQGKILATLILVVP